MNESKIVLTGVKETLDSLKQFDKDAVKEFNKILTTEMSGLKRQAQDLVTAKPPLSGWATQPPRNPRTRGGAGWPNWDQSIIRAGISSTRAQGRVKKDYTTSAAALKNKSAAGVIYEIAGRTNKSPGRNNFISNLSSKDGSFMPSRLIWNVIDKDKSKVAQKIYDALEKAKQKLQDNLSKERG